MAGPLDWGILLWVHSKATKMIVRVKDAIKLRVASTYCEKASYISYHSIVNIFSVSLRLESVSSHLEQSSGFGIYILRDL